MSRRSHRRRARIQPGSPPGLLTAPEGAEPTRIYRLLYDADKLEESELPRAELDKIKVPIPARTLWLRIVGLRDTETVRALGSTFRLHPLTLEDILYPDHRPKVEFAPDYLFFILRVPDGSSPSKKHGMVLEQVSLVLGEGCVLSFEARDTGFLAPVYERLAGGRTRIRSAGADYLFYALSDALVDHYFLTLEEVGESLDQLEEQVLTDPEQTVIQDLQGVKQQLTALRKGLWPLREAVGRLARDAHPLITPEVRIYLHDVYDHAVQALETVETLRDTDSALLEIYLSLISQRMNEVMKVLTIIATIFIPLTFIVGVYGMNFDYMPELHYRWAYPLVWVVMLLVAAGMLWYFRRKRWL